MFIIHPDFITECKECGRLLYPSDTRKMFDHFFNSHSHFWNFVLFAGEAAPQTYDELLHLDFLEQHVPTEIYVTEECHDSDFEH